MQGMRERDAIESKAHRECYPSNEFVHLSDSIAVVENARSSHGRKGSGIALESVERVNGILVRLS